MEDSDAQLQLKKRARRRLVGAVAFFSVVAVVLPMVMDHEPRQPVQDVEIRIPGQDEKPFAPKFAVAPVDKPAAKAAEPLPPPAEVSADKPEVQVARVIEKPLDKSPEITANKLLEKTSDKPAEKSREKSVDKTVDKLPEKVNAKPEKVPEKQVEKPAAKNDSDAKRAAAILAGQGIPTVTAAPAAKSEVKAGEFVVLIGAFTNEANVRNLKSKLGEQNIRTFSEPLDTPQGKKTRVRAGPFPTREAAEKALEKMQRIGVSGVVSGK